MRKKRPFFPFDDIFEEMRREMERLMNYSFSSFSEEELEKLAKKPGANVYGFSIRIGPDGKPIIREFGNIKKTEKSEKPITVSKEREPLVDIIPRKKEIIIVAEVPGVDKKELELTGNEKEIIIHVPKKYHKVIKLPDNVLFKKAKAKYKNGLLEIIIPKTKEKQTKKTKIKVE